MALNLFSGASILFASLALSACTGPSIYTPMPQSNFTYPNSSVAPLTHVRASVRQTYIAPFQTPDFADARMQREAYFKALQGSGGDLIIDGDYAIRSTVIWIPLLPVYFFNVEGIVEGTAAKIVEVGERRLR
jgi:hypothetical protein